MPSVSDGVSFYMYHGLLSWRFHSCTCVDVTIMIYDLHVGYRLCRARLADGSLSYIDDTRRGNKLVYMMFVVCSL